MSDTPALDPAAIPRSEFVASLAGTTATEAAVIAELAERAVEPAELEPGTVYSVVVPTGARVEQFDLERFAGSPFRPRGTYRPATVDALISHVDRYFDSEHSTIWVHPTTGRVVALLNDHAREDTGWGDFRSQLDLQKTSEWLFWCQKDGVLMPQGDFAEHVEDGVKEIVEPAAADMLELAQSFHAAQSASFRSATRLQDGTVQMQYDETVDATAGRSGQMEIPQEFTLSLSPFLGEDPYRVTARLRYRLSGGTLKLGYRLERPDDIIRDALTHIAGRLTDKFTHVFLGEPPA